MAISGLIQTDSKSPARAASRRSNTDTWHSLCQKHIHPIACQALGKATAILPTSSRNSQLLPAGRSLNHGPVDSQVQNLLPPIQPTQHKHHPPITTLPAIKTMFLRFPPEIRNTIYSALLNPAAQPVPLKPSSPTNPLTILGVCKQTHDEALPIFYRPNDFRLADPDALYQFLRSLSLRRRRQIAHVTVGYWDRRSKHATAAFAMLGQCIRLASLRVCLAQGGSRLRRFAGIKALRALRGLEEVAFVREGDGMVLGGKFLEGVKKGMLEPRTACKMCERVGRPV